MGRWCLSIRLFYQTGLPDELDGILRQEITLKFSRELTFGQYQLNIIYLQVFFSKMNSRMTVQCVIRERFH
jgi:hypothetical protein